MQIYLCNIRDVRSLVKLLYVRMINRLYVCDNWCFVIIVLLLLREMLTIVKISLITKLSEKLLALVYYSIAELDDKEIKKKTTSDLHGDDDDDDDDPAPIEERRKAHISQRNLLPFFFSRAKRYNRKIHRCSVFVEFNWNNASLGKEDTIYILLK